MRYHFLQPSRMLGSIYLLPITCTIDKLHVDNTIISSPSSFGLYIYTITYRPLRCWGCGPPPQSADSETTVDPPTAG